MPRLDTKIGHKKTAMRMSSIFNETETTRMAVNSFCGNAESYTQAWLHLGRKLKWLLLDGFADGTTSDAGNADSH